MHKIEQRSVMMNKGANKLKTLIDNFQFTASQIHITEKRKQQVHKQ